MILNEQDDLRSVACRTPSSDRQLAMRTSLVSARCDTPHSKSVAPHPCNTRKDQNATDHSYPTECCCTFRCDISAETSSVSGSTALVQMAKILIMLMSYENGIAQIYHKCIAEWRTYSPRLKNHNRSRQGFHEHHYPKRLSTRSM